MILRTRSLVMLGTPAVAMATVALGLRVGAGDTLRRALVEAAPPSRGRSVSVWQIHVLDEVGPVRSPAPRGNITLTARRGSTVATAKGDLLDDGVVDLELPAALGPSTLGEAVTLEVRSSEGLVLAAGFASPPPPGWGPWARGAGITWARPNERRGDLEVAVEGQRLAADLPGRVWLRARGSALPVVTAEEGLHLDGPLHACGDAWWWAPVTATHHLAGLTVTQEPDGRWFGPLLVAPGAAVVTGGAAPVADKPTELVLRAPPNRRRIYVEVEDDQGRAFATSVNVMPTAGGYAEGPLTLPSLAAGPYWLVTSTEPRGATTLGGGTVARPFLVAKGHEASPALGADPCGDPQAFVRSPGTGFPRWVALDGFVDGRATMARRRGLGAALAVAALALAALVEVTLVVGGARRARQSLEDAFAAQGEEAPSPPRGGGGVNVFVALLLTLLGFALLGSLVLHGA